MENIFFFSVIKVNYLGRQYTKIVLYSHYRIILMFPFQPVLFLKIQPELDLLIQSAIWFGSVGKRCSTFGQQLLVLAYDSERLTISRLVLHFCLTVLPSYIKKLEERRLNRRVEWLSKAIEYGENAALILSVLNFFRFLKTGRKPTLIDFLLGLDYISLRHNQRRDIGYKYLTRELLWGGFMVR